MSAGHPYGFGFENPFAKNHCAVLAVASIKREPSAAFALDLARRTKAAGLITEVGGARMMYARIEEWARLAGLRVVARYRPEITVLFGKRILPGYYHWDDDGNRVPLKIEVRRFSGRPTVAKFLRTRGRRGRWVIATDGHAQASINGRLRGTANRRDRVHWAVRFEELGG